MGAGVAFVVLFVASVLLMLGDIAEVKSSDSPARAGEKWLHELSSSGHRVGLLIGGYALIFAAIAFVWFCNGLRERLALSPSSGRLVTALSVLGAASITVAALLGAAFAGSVELGNVPLPANGETIWIVSELFFPFMFVVFSLVSAVVIGVITVSASDALPRWLRYAGWVGVLGSLAGVMVLPFVLALLWYLAVAIVGLRARAAAAPPAPVPAGVG
jgi:hypothetical protein